MALSFTEMRALQKQGTATMAELKAGGLNFVEIRKKQREKAEIMAKLKGDAVKPEPDPAIDEESTDEEAEQAVSRSVVGFRFTGAKHPAWVKNYEEKTLDGADVVVSNEALEIAILLPHSTVVQSTQEVARDSLRIAWPFNTRGTSNELRYEVIQAEAAWRGIKSPFPAKMRKKVRRLVEMAQRYVNKAFAEGVDGFTLESIGRSVKISKDDRVGTGRTVTAAYALWRNGDLGLAGIPDMLKEGDFLGARGLLFKHMAELSYESPISPPRSAAELEAIIAQIKPVLAMPEVEGIGPLFVRNVEETLAKLEAQLAAMAPEPEPEPVPEVEPEPVVEDSLSVRYLRGDFNQEAPADFRGRILAVANEGMALDDLKTGAVNWIKANPDLIAA